ncbi:MAG: Nif3-like dinuclear metal center hexameric protein [Nitrospinae bacterium]|nr:Nif3-like dinuclear metal center hexameric protein [Nitrospinota bacterium]
MKEIIRWCEKLAPPSCAMEGDNIGLIVGEPKKCTGAVVALDVTAEALSAAEQNGCNLLVVHHSPIYQPIKRIDTAEPRGKLLARAIKSGIAIYVMHTNLDFAPNGLNQHVAQMLGLKNIRAVSAPDKVSYRIGVLPADIPARDFARRIKERLSIKSARLCGTGKIKTVAVCTGSGADLLSHAVLHGADALVTGDVRHHHAMECRALGAVLIDAGHHGTEQTMVGLVCGFLKKMMVKSGKRTTIVPLYIAEPFENV